MNKFLKENWFKLGILIIGGTTVYYYLHSLPKVNGKEKVEFERTIFSKKSAKEDLELQAMCSKKVEAIFNEQYAPYWKEYHSTYTNHYNRKLGKCFMLISQHQFIDGVDGGTLTTMSLMDIYENKEQAGFSRLRGKHYTEPDNCYVFDRGCKDEWEFNGLVKPYMEE